ncbi:MULTISPECIES: CamS family sex pheromone protein [Staphylococcus]|uniref:CamS family sex pheromone protein n=1 Tax=Staphylococcus TaxID=1279 RepID=UPI00187FF0CA|nr:MULTISPECIES: CamS family sex pheromone protein [unclassified Staphylococcus]MBF2758468.1 CamS family sex pheromone protein [Staphylococcus haemolyticus]MBF2773127.1 CamS family sex pheromone protein [Staphylococcus haemolyticus]MBF2777346.1 CamS family sex pheromone protein [Staphylococcus haemolyticus]MBF2815249.1 CamS family sex pheromone protein [Staphylococcus haemolyticus]MBF9720635.1 CamS family sex pheromone protein [Staphylococcus haemolyticus]
MKRTLFLILTSLVLLAACGNDNDNKNNQSVNKQETKSDSNNVKTIATDKNVQGDNYRTILPFKESKARGVLQDNMANSYNGDDFESGLLKLSKDVFPTDDYLYQDGQYLDKDTINSYLNPKYTKKEIDKMSDKEKESNNASENLGLNPSHKGEDDPEKIAEQSPAYLSNILEQDFYDSSDTKGKNIKGMTIGLAMNSVYYYQKEKDGETYSKELDDKEIEKQGKQMASEILTRLRANDDLKDIPIHFAIYKQSDQNSITPGEFIANTTVDDDQTKINKWNKIDQVSALLPSSTAEKYNENLNNNFKQFNNNLQSYFTNFTQAVGKVKFEGKKPTQLTIDLPIDYYGQAETIGITQYVTEQAQKYFDNIDSYEIRIKDGNTPRALISKSKEDKEPQVHIYNN